MDGCMPIIDVTEENFEAFWPTIRNAVESSSFVAVDLELSGLGDRKKINTPEVDLRYEYLSEVTKQYSVVSIGLSCFFCQKITDVILDNEDISDISLAKHLRSHSYVVQTFNILTLCTDVYSVECDALKFLVQHGFDFNKQYAKGVKYYRGCDKLANKGTKLWPNARALFSLIVKHVKPLVVHNGFIDLVFLYQSFYADLPKNVDIFAADLSEMFPNGIYDTKYLSEFGKALPASYLEYLYKKKQLWNQNRCDSEMWHVRINFPAYPCTTPYLEWHPYLQIHSYDVATDSEIRPICHRFASYGWCSVGVNCNKSHNTDQIVQSQIEDIDVVMAGTRKQQRLEGKGEGECAENGEDTFISSPMQSGCNNEVKIENFSGIKNVPPKKQAKKDGNNEVVSNVGHRAGFDAFMTGFVFSCYVAEAQKLTSNEIFSANAIGLEDSMNKVYLVGKNIPFLVRMGTYAKLSAHHSVKKRKL